MGRNKVWIRVVLLTATAIVSLPYAKLVRGWPTQNPGKVTTQNGQTDAKASASKAGQAPHAVGRMRPAWAIRVATDEVLKLASQLGIHDIIVYGGPGTGLIPGTNRPLKKARPDYDDYVALRRRLESYGLRIAGIEGGFIGNPRYRDVFYGGPKRDELIDELIAEIRDMARAGIPIYAYHWMGNSVWRTKSVKIRGGATATALDFKQLQQVQDRPTCEKMRAAGELGFSVCELLPESPGRTYSEEALWQNLEYWIRKVTPVAEKEGIRLGIHPDDPPVPQIAGVPRLLRNHAAFRRLIEIYPSDSNAIEFCQGTFSEMKDDVYDAIRYFGSRKKILYVHFRNVSGRVPEFHEEFINTGYVDMRKAMRLYREVSFKGVLIDDHCPEIEGDEAFPGNLGGYRSRIFALGYIQGLLDSLSDE